MTHLSPLRTGRITGSRIGAILGLNRYSTRDEVMREMVRQNFEAPAEFEGNEATAYGSAHENDAITAYEIHESVLVWGGQDFLIHPQHDWLASTPDGLVGLDGMVEVKCPPRAQYTHIDQKPEYCAQIRLQLECAGRDWCDFVVWRPTGIDISRVTRNPDWLTFVLPALRAFMDEYLAIVDHEDKWQPYLEPKSKKRAA